MTKIRLSMTGSNHLEFEHRRGLSKTCQQIPLDAIDPEPVLYRSVQWGWLFASVVLIAVTAFILAGYVTNDGSNYAQLFFAGCFALLAVGVVYKTYFGFRSLYVYLDPATKGHLFSIRASGSGKADPLPFMDTLRKKINSIRYPDELAPNQKVNIYRKHLEFLRDEGVIRSDEHDSIVARLERKVRPADVVNLRSPKVE